jgi:nucleoside-diphosphate-sugar epimerase
MSDLCREWEEAAQGGRAYGVQVECMRFGLVLGLGGALPMMLLPILLGLGGKLGSGRQWLSWIHVDDVVRGMAHRWQQGEAGGARREPAPPTSRRRNASARRSSAAPLRGSGAVPRWCRRPAGRCGWRWANSRPAAGGAARRHALLALRAAGCTVTGVSRCRPAGERPEDWLEMDFGSMTREQDWLPLLAGVDAVVNCVGIIREARDGDFDRLHRAAPVAVFAACERIGVRRVVQVSALGSHPDAVTGYWRSKGAADANLLARHALSVSVVRPSLVYGG